MLNGPLNDLSPTQFEAALLVLGGITDAKTLHNLNQARKNWKQCVDEIIKYRKAVFNIMQESPFFSNQDLFSFRIKRLKDGLTNHTFLITLADGSSYIIRVPGQKTESFINRQHECENATLLSQLNLSPPIIYFNPVTGSQITKYIENSRTLSEGRLKKESVIKKLGKFMYHFHHILQPNNNATNFSNKVNVFDRNTAMLEIVKNITPKISPDDQKLHDAINALRNFFPNYRHYWPSHNDATPTNFLEMANKELLAIDLEYSALNDMEIWDLLAIIVDGKMDHEQIKKLIHAYFDYYDPIIFHQIIILTPVYEYWCYIWTQVQLANNNIMKDKETLENYGKQKLASCIQHLNSSDFATSIKRLENFSLALVPARLFQPKNDIHSEPTINSSNTKRHNRGYN